MAETKIEPTLASLSDRLRVLHSQTRETPLFNPVFQLSLDISRKLESGELGIDALAGLVDELEAQSLDARAVRLGNLLEPQEADRRLATLAAAGDDFERFRASWERPHMHAVFTAHPTFLLTPRQSEAGPRRSPRDAKPIRRAPPRRPKSRCATSTNAPWPRWPMRRMRATASWPRCCVRRAGPIPTAGPNCSPCRSASPAGSVTTWTGAPISPGTIRSPSAWPKRRSGWGAMRIRSKQST